MADIKADATKVQEPFEEDDKEESYNRADEIISRMRLTKKQKLTPKCYLQGMSVTQIARLLHVVNSTVRRSRIVMQKKYNALN